MLIDSHCHLADDAFVEDVGEVIARAKSAGLSHALCIIAAENGVELQRALSLADIWQDVRFGVGLHPHQAAHVQGKESDVQTLVKDVVARLPGVRAIGEIGLDYHYDFAPRSVQQSVFRHQIRLASELGLPVIVHTREAEDDTIAILREESGGSLRGVLHCFTGSPALAGQAIALGMHISFAGIVTFPKAAELRAVVPQVPDDRLLCETDSPYLAPTPFRGKRNEPAWVARVVETLAAARQTSVEHVTNQISTNFSALFSP